MSAWALSCFLPQTKLMQTGIGLIGNSKLTEVAKVSENGCLSLCVGPVMVLGTCPECTQPLAQCQLGLAPAPPSCNPQRNKWCSWIDDWMDVTSNPLAAVKSKWNYWPLRKCMCQSLTHIIYSRHARTAMYVHMTHHIPSHLCSGVCPLPLFCLGLVITQISFH